MIERQTKTSPPSPPNMVSRPAPPTMTLLPALPMMVLAYSLPPREIAVAAVGSVVSRISTSEPGARL